MHHERWRKTGDPGPAAPKRIRNDVRARVLSKVVVDAHGCWLWQGGKVDGYGVTRVAGANRVAHRVAYEVLVGAVPDGMQLDHLCRERACVNPAHLEPVTPSENTRRMWAARP